MGLPDTFEYSSIDETPILPLEKVQWKTPISRSKFRELMGLTAKDAGIAYSKLLNMNKDLLINMGEEPGPETAAECKSWLEENGEDAQTMNDVNLILWSFRKIGNKKRVAKALAKAQRIWE